MANRKISQLTALTTPAAGDYLPIVDISEAAAADQNKRITIEDLLRGAPDGTAAAPSIAFESDPDTGIYSSGADQVSVATNGTERLRIDSTGQIEAVSLGTAAAPTFSFTGDPNTGIYSPGADQVALSTNGTGRLFVDASGNVGVGVSNPGDYDSGSDDFVVGRSGNAGITIAAGTSSFSRLQFADGTGASTYRGFLMYSHADDDMRIGTAGGERLRITSAGLVGIGTSSPDKLLHLSNSSGPVLRFENTDTTITAGESFGSIEFESNDASASSGVVAKIEGFAHTTMDGSTVNGGAIRFSTATVNPVTLAERLRIDSSGRVGIGTTSPATTLDVNGDVTITDKIIHASDTNTAIRFPADDTVSIETAGSERARIDSSGRLLVGTSSARGNFRFEIEGTIFQDSVASITRNAANAASAWFYIKKSRGSSAGSYTSVIADDALGAIGFTGADGTSDVLAASITAHVDGTPGTNDMPGRLVFSVTADGAASPTEALRISSNRAITVSDGGHIVLGTGTGTKIGTSTSQKIGFFDETPIVQPTTGIAEAAFVENSGGTAVNVDSTFGGYTIQQVVQALQNLGLLA